MKRPYLNLKLTSVIVLIAVGVLLPVMLSTAAGIVSLVIAGNTGGIITGVLVISFTATAAGCALITVVLMGRKARLARLQADFVANVSHELRTPLSAIKLYTQALQSGKLAGDPEKTAQCLATILRETEWLNLMVERVLTWRASSRDMMALEMETVPVTQAVADAAERFRAMTQPDELELSVSIESRLRVRHDPKALNQVVLNLLTNAYKYTGREKRISIRVRDENAAVMIAVEDNGIGVGPGELKHIFQPFYRAAGGRGDAAGGDGLGLAIAQYLVARQGGEIAVRSEGGKGSEFTIRLPAQKETP